MEEIFALVYVDYEGLSLLDIGNKDFILKRYNDKIKKRKEFEEKYRHFYDDEMDYYKTPEKYHEQDKEGYLAFISHEGRHIDNPKRLCVMGYKDNRIQCVCKDFGMGSGETIFY